MICNYCNSENADDTKFCIKCGKRIEINKPNVCKECGKELKPNSKFCTYCGTPVDAENAKELVNQAMQSKLRNNEVKRKGEKKSIILVCVLILLVFALAGVGVYFAFSLSDKNDIDNNVRIVSELNVEENGEKTTENEEAMEIPQADIVETDTEMSNVNTDSIDDEQPITIEEYDELDDDYIIPYSDTVLLTEDDVKGLSLQEVNYAKNEIYARHGRKFASRELQNYFNSKSWYYGTIEAKDFDKGNYLSSIENKNAALLSKIEKEMGTYELDQ